MYPVRSSPCPSKFVQRKLGMETVLVVADLLVPLCINLFQFYEKKLVMEMEEMSLIRDGIR
jgi:hypothetical protein